MNTAWKLLAEVADAGCQARLNGNSIELSQTDLLGDDLIGRLRAHKAELLELLSANDDHDQAPEATQAPWAVPLLDSALDEPVISVSGPEAAAWPEARALGLPVFDRAELDNGAGVEEWTAVVHIKRQMPGSRIVGFETIAP